MPVDASHVEFFNGGDGTHFSYVRGQLIVRDEPSVWSLIGVEPDDDRVVRPPDAIDDLRPLALVSGFTPGDEIGLAAQHPNDLELDHVMYAHHAPHPSQLPHAGRVSELTGNWVRPLPHPGPLGAAEDAYSGMRASPLHMNPLHMNPLDANPLNINPLHMNPLGIHPLHMNPLHMNGLASSAVPTTPDRRIGPIPPPPDEPHSGEQTVAVYIIDTGLGRQSTQAAVNYESQVLPVYGTIAGTHADAPDRWAPWGTPPPQFFVDPVAGHGTFIAGIYGQLLHADGRHPVITVFQDMNERGMIDEWDAYARIGAILAAHGDLPGVINLSFGGTLADFSIGGLNALKLAVDAASERFVVVASAGNVSMEKEHYPAAFGSAIGVGALDANGVAWFSNFGEWVECWAPGVDIISPFLQLIPKWKSPLFTHQGITMQGVILGTDFQGFNDPNLGHDYRSKWVAWSGTSFAAPIVGARAAEHLAGGDGLDAAKAKVLSEFPLNQL